MLEEFPGQGHVRQEAGAAQEEERPIVPNVGDQEVEHGLRLEESAPGINILAHLSQRLARQQQPQSAGTPQKPGPAPAS